MTLFRIAALGLIALAVVACEKTTAIGDDAFGQKVRAYLLAHPEVLREVSQKLEAKYAADEVAARHKAIANLPALRSAVERDPHDFVANPGGTITLTQFFDYRCPHCVNVAPKVMALIKTHPDVRVVFKEMPIFGPLSEHAARAALAVKSAGGNYLGLYQSFMAARPLEDAAVDPTALAEGARPADLTGAAAAAAQAQLARNGALFSKLDLGGTPAFIIGDQIILGEDMDAVNAAVAKAEAARKAG
jgi:protein-disulfide isomerase